jgi:multiple sugar transport system permease protein
MGPAPQRSHMSNLQRLSIHYQRNKFYYGMIMPLALIMIVLYAYPVVYSVYLSFTSYDYAVIDGRPEWTGLENFAKFFSSTEGRQVIRNTFVFTLVAVPIETVLGLLLASMWWMLRYRGSLRLTLLCLP